jgi:hypothetical protein
MAATVADRIRFWRMLREVRQDVTDCVNLYDNR